MFLRVSKIIAQSILFVSICFGVTIYGAVADNTSNSQPLDKIVAVVNQEIITQSELNQALDRAKARIAMMQVPSPTPSILREQVLNDLIDEKLQGQIARKMNLKATPKQVEQAIQNIAQQNNLTVDQLKQQITQHGISFPDYQKNIERQLVLQQLMQQVAGSNVAVTKADIEQFTLDYKKQAQFSGAQFHVLDILISVSDPANTAQVQMAQDKAKDIIARLKQGADPSQVVANQTGVQILDLGWRSLGELPELFSSSLASLGKGEVAGPFKAGNGYHVIQLLEKRGQDVTLPSNTQIQQIIYQQKMQKELKKWLDELRKQSYIHITDS